ncbi:MAG: GspH/FimT family pseudopilin [Magnetococcales bacterium]|nr:GspH/FimT family pseudopilin [Magnetococcales bacterium]
MRPTTPSSPSPIRGFTLVETLITLGIVAILMSLGLPYMKNAILTQQVKNAVSDLHFSLVHARSEAIKRNANVTLTPTGTWNDGWSVLSGATTLKTQDSFPNLTITGPVGSVTYQRNGRPAAAVTDFQVSVSGNTAVTMRCVSIGANGVPHTTIDSDSNPTNGCTP